jgi:D-beta-D-heptose 7-phosphate kinase/D-beta-D-heptose 1-phosphate adenosyltransferase
MQKKMEILFVIVNNDKQRELKGSKEFMNQDERIIIVKKLKMLIKYSYL